jgi:hypothetical protein
LLLAEQLHLQTGHSTKQLRHCLVAAEQHLRQQQQVMPALELDAVDVAAVVVVAVVVAVVVVRMASWYFLE